MEERNTITELERIIKEKEIGKKVEINGRTFVVDEKYGLREIDEKEYLLCDTVRLTDLQSFCTLIKEEIEKLDTKLFIQVINPKTVVALTTLDDKNRRFDPYICECHKTGAEFNNFNEYERFVINLRANFEQTDDTLNVMRMIGNIVNCDNQELQDDGVTQSVRTQRGTQIGSQDVKSIIRLAPFRTFPEVPQPISEFLFRIKDNGTRFGLFEADGGRWEIEAKRNIADFIRANILGYEDKVVVLM